MLICQNAMLAGSISLPFMFDRKKKKIDRIAYSDASVIVIKSRKSKGYAIADTDCIISHFSVKCPFFVTLVSKGAWIWGVWVRAVLLYSYTQHFHHHQHGNQRSPFKELNKNTRSHLQIRFEAHHVARPLQSSLSLASWGDAPVFCTSVGPHRLQESRLSPSVLALWATQYW